jgi:serine/threonine protein kinase
MLIRLFNDLWSKETFTHGYCYIYCEGALSEPLLRKYMLDILTGLNFLHSKGIIHRGMKILDLMFQRCTMYNCCFFNIRHKTVEFIVGQGNCETRGFWLLGNCEFERRQQQV